MSSKLKDIPDQVELWDIQHCIRGNWGPEGLLLQNVPNDSAVEFETVLPRQTTILEVGSANGRDARYWASKGHTVYALDFSQVALEQLKQLAIAQQVDQLIVPLIWNIAEGKLPLNMLPQSIFAFYARSALHIGDDEMILLAEQIDRILVPGGKILIEGKASKDRKILRSRKIGKGLAVDDEENGHLRRVWNVDFVEFICSEMRWSIIKIKSNMEDWNGTEAQFLSFLIQKGK
jgi:SAM-dependent methyltransferase